VDFGETYTFIQSLPVTYLHVFTYSVRPNTPAAEFDLQVDPKIKSRRNKVLRELGVTKRAEFYTSLFGKSLPVLFEGKVIDGEISGLTPNYIRVVVPGDESLVNSIHPIRIAEVYDEYCRGLIGQSVQSENKSVVKEAV
jgi:threonylcarbamoyladenosine tRNA methylthiotransferase MtaB